MYLLSRSRARGRASSRQGPLSVNAIHGREVLPSVAILLIAELMKKHALPVGALLMAKPGGAVLRCTELCSKHPISILGSINCLDAAGGVFLFLEGDIDTK